MTSCPGTFVEDFSPLIVLLHLLRIHVVCLSVDSSILFCLGDGAFDGPQPHSSLKLFCLFYFLHVHIGTLQISQLLQRPIFRGEVLSGKTLAWQLQGHRFNP